MLSYGPIHTQKTPKSAPELLEMSFNQMSVLSPLFSHSALASLSLALSLSQHTHDLAQVTAWLTPIVTPGLMGGGWSV